MTGATTTHDPAARVAREWMAAGIGCSMADTLFNPLEVLKVRAQAEANSGRSLRQLVAEGMSSTGLLVPGLLATWMRGLSYTGFRIGLYPSVRDNTPLSGFTGKLCAGAVTGSIGAAVFNPIDVVRIRMQGSSPYSTTLSAFGTILKEEGAIKGLWGGTGVCVMRAMFLSGSQLATYDTAKRVLLKNGVFSEDRPPLHFTSSFLSGIIAQTVTQPVDTLKTLVMSRRGAPTRVGAAGIAMELIRKHGILGLYRGYWPAMARQGPVMVIQMPIVEQLRRMMGLDYF